MSSAWGNSFKSAWGNSWGSVAPVPVITIDKHDGERIDRKYRRKREILRNTLEQAFSALEPTVDIEVLESARNNAPKLDFRRDINEITDEVNRYVSTIYSSIALSKTRLYRQELDRLQEEDDIEALMMLQ